MDHMWFWEAKAVCTLLEKKRIREQIRKFSEQKAWETHLHYAFSSRLGAGVILLCRRRKPLLAPLFLQCFEPIASMHRPTMRVSLKPVVCWAWDY